MDRKDNLEKADKAYKKAKKFMSTTLLRWKPDYEQAARFLRDAIKEYHMCGPSCQEQLINALLDSSKAHEEISSFHIAAEAAETAAKIFLERNNKTKSVQTFKKAGDLYGLNNSHNKSSSNYVKAADILAKEDPTGAITLLQEACQKYVEEDRPEFHESTFKKAVTICVQNKRIDDALYFLRKQIPLQLRMRETFESDVYKNHLAIIVLLMHKGLVDEADSELRKQSNILSYSSSSEFFAASDLLSAYYNGSSEELENVLKRHSAFKYIHNSITSIARCLSLSEKQIEEGTQRREELQKKLEETDITESQEENPKKTIKPKKKKPTSVPVDEDDNIDLL